MLQLTWEFFVIAFCSPHGVNVFSLPDILDYRGEHYGEA